MDLLSKENVDSALFTFLKSIYLFEQRERELFGVSWKEVYLMQLLKREGKLSVTQISKKLKIEDFQASRTISKLFLGNFVSREKVKGDNRLVLVGITERGLKKIEMIEQFNYEMVVSQLNDYPNSEKQILLEMIENLDKILGLKA